jgi:RNA polymerase sigma factor (sigma-70 family)
LKGKAHRAQANGVAELQGWAAAPRLYRSDARHLTERGYFFRPRLAYPEQPAGADAASHRKARFRDEMLPHLDAAYTYARYLARDAARAEDIVQEAFLRAFRGFDTWQGTAARAWLFAIVRNCFLAATSEPQWQSLDGAEITGTDRVEHRHPEAIIADADEAAMLRRTICDLPQPFRETLVLRELEELSYKEIASLTNVPMGTVMSRLARGRQMLAELLLSADPENEQQVRP